MKLNLKKFLLPIFCVFMLFFVTFKANAAEFIELNYENTTTTYILTLNQQELIHLSQANSSIETSDQRYTVTNKGMLIKNLCRYPELFLTQIDFTPYTSPTCGYEGNFMDVTLTGGIYRRDSTVKQWNKVSVKNRKTGKQKTFRVCHSAHKKHLKCAIQ